ncbi:MAG: methyltransferase family protein [Candidatus Methanospirareceae archaeon]
MSTIFVLTTIFIALSILVEAILLGLQLVGRRLTRWLGTYAFSFFACVVLTLWFVLLYLLIRLQYEEHPLFHMSAFVRYVGLVLFFTGIILAAWSFSLLGVKRVLCINFFVDNVSLVTGSVYRYLKNPAHYGFWLALIGFAVYTGSWYNFAIALEFVVVMIPIIWLENKPLQDARPRRTG